MKTHNYTVSVEWSDNIGTKGYTDYSRNHTILSENKEAINCSSDPVFRGDKSKYNPEELLVAAVSQCHMLWFLHLASESKVVVKKYNDTPVGFMEEYPDGSGKFTLIQLNPVIQVENPTDASLISILHEDAHKKCFIANSLNCKVEISECRVFLL